MNPQQRAFVNAYLGEAKGNGTKAAIIAGYSERTASVIASQLLRKPAIKAAVTKALDKADLTTQARLQKLGTIADATPEKVTAADVISANALILKVNGALKDKASESRITVNIGFLNAPPANVTVTATHIEDNATDAEVLAPLPQAASISAESDLCLPVPRGTGEGPE